MNATLAEQAVDTATDWPSWLALVVAGAALGWQVLTHFLGREDRQRRDEEMIALRRAQTEALIRIAESASGSKGSAAAEEGAALSARLDRGRGGRLVVTNLGPGGALLKSVATVGQDVLLDPPQSSKAVDLLPGESLSILAPITFGTSLPLEVEMSWLDSRGDQVRRQVVNFS